MKRLHINLAVADVEASIAFYSRLFGAPPTVRKTDYAKWLLDDPRVNFSLGNHAEDGGRTGIEHLGIEAESREELQAPRERVGTLPVEQQGETVCCYARSDKTWVRDDQGVAWELFYTIEESETYFGSAVEPPEACCD